MCIRDRISIHYHLIYLSIKFEFWLLTEVHIIFSGIEFLGQNSAADVADLGRYAYDIHE